ncbi:hypothetical protein AKJ16_DCAP09552 [Drosera capensis]
MAASSDLNFVAQHCVHERKKSFMKWLTKLFQSGSCHELGSQHRHPSFLEDESTDYPASSRSLVMLSCSNLNNFVPFKSAGIDGFSQDLI